MAIQWTEALAVGVQEIDEQHKELFKRVNSLLDACNQGKGKEIVNEVIGFLGEYVVTHFNTEERIMKAANYPGLTEQKAQHKQFIESFADLKSQFVAQGAGIQIVILTNRLVVDWLTSHISKSDKAIGVFLNKMSPAVSKERK